jgi:outer membrane lipopolysaccharide assembly protein LptE/RlpB|tara:strand:- start:328 stop:780 length:453 start_codon:yes stop_codon:yes gene_type:complete
MKKIFIVFLLILTSCGYQPLYKTDQNIKSLNISEVIYSGDQKINDVIYQKLPIVLVKNDESLNKLSLESKKEIKITSKNSKGQALSYRTIIKVKILVLNSNGDILDQKIVQKNFSYNADENKFKFKEYQDKIEKNLIDTIVEDVIIHLTY